MSFYQIQIAELIGLEPTGTTGILKAAWCRWTHKGTRNQSMPAAGRSLWYPIHCSRCGARYERVRPNNPQYAGGVGAWGRPDRLQPGRWFEADGTPTTDW